MNKISQVESKNIENIESKSMITLFIDIGLYTCIFLIDTGCEANLIKEYFVKANTLLMEFAMKEMV